MSSYVDRRDTKPTEAEAVLIVEKHKRTVAAYVERRKRAEQTYTHENQKYISPHARVMQLIRTAEAAAARRGQFVEAVSVARGAK